MRDETKRVMPKQLNLGQFARTPICQAIYTREKMPYNIGDRRSVMGYPLPSWQRPFVWTDKQCIRFIESAWLGLNLGTYTYNRCDHASEYDGLLIDGQQRLRALERYLDDEFPVFGYRWSEVTDGDRRRFEMVTIFSSYATETRDEDYLRSYYDMMNFGGTAHTEDQRALA